MKETKVIQNATRHADKSARCNNVSGYEWGTSERTRCGVGVLNDANELGHLVADEDEERDVDREGDEREHSGQEREEGGDEGNGDVRGEGEEEGDEGDAGGWEGG